MYRDNKPAVSVVVPCYNEQEVLPLYLQAMQEVIKKMEPVTVEIIFVDDGSADETLKLLKEFHEKDNNGIFPFPEISEKNQRFTPDLRRPRESMSR